MNKNIIPIRKHEHFGIFLGKILPTGEVLEGESVGIAFLKHGSKKFRLKVFTFPGHRYFIVPDEKDNSKYAILSLEEYHLQTGEIRANWNRVGDGRLVGNFIALRIQLLPENLFLCLFPGESEPNEDALAS